MTRAVLAGLLAACASVPLAEPAPFEQRPSQELAGTVADRVDPYTRLDEVARRMAGSGFCARGELFVPCSRGTRIQVRFAYRGERMVAMELAVPRGGAGAYLAHKRALETRFGPPTREERAAASWRLAENWSIRLERDGRGTVRERHSYLP